MPAAALSAAACDACVLKRTAWPSGLELCAGSLLTTRGRQTTHNETSVNMHSLRTRGWGRAKLNTFQNVSTHCARSVVVTFRNIACAAVNARPFNYIYRCI